MTAAEAITQAAKALHTVILTYTDVKGSTTTREVEPYSWRPGGKSAPAAIRFFAWDMDKGEIRGFRMDRVATAQVTDRTYVPRWVVEI